MFVQEWLVAVSSPSSPQIRFRATYPSSVGRNVDEILRVLDALQLTDGWTPPATGEEEGGVDETEVCLGEASSAARAHILMSAPLPLCTPLSPLPQAAAPRP